MATTALWGTPVQTIGDLPSNGSAAPGFTLVDTDFSEVTLLTGKKTVLNIFPGIDGRLCSASVRTFNELAAGMRDTTVICVSSDLPFALARFCGVEGIENVTAASSFKSSFGTDYGVAMKDGRFEALLARSVVIIDANGNVIYSELVPEIAQEPDYDAALAALR